MKKRFLLLLPVLLIGIIAFVVSCVRNQDVYWDSPDLKSQRPLTVADAQGWFEKEYSDDITVARSVQNGSSTRMVSYAAGVFAGSPDWATARPFRKNYNSLIVTLDYLNPNTTYRGFRDVIVVRNHKTKSFNAWVQLQLFDTAYLNNQKRIKGPREHIREYSDPATFTGKVYRYSINNEFIRGAIYKNGKLIARVFPKNKISSFFNSPSSSTAKKSYVPYNGGANLGRAPGTDVSKAVKIHSRSVVASYEEPPVRMSYSGGDSTDTDEYDTNDPDSNMETVVVTAPGTGTGTQPDTDTCDPLWGDTCDGSGDDGGGDPYPTDPNDSGGGGGTSGGGGTGTSTAWEIISDVKDPCISSQLNASLSSGLKNEISTYINSVFGNSNKFVLQFTDGAISGPDSTADATAGTTLLSGFPLTYKTSIKFNTSKLGSASKEYIAATAFHEYMHAWIDHQYPTASDNVDQHNLMASTSRFNQMRDALREMFPSMSQQDAEDLTWGGLGKTAAWHSLDPLTKANIIQKNNDYRSGLLGTGCP